MGTVKVWVTGVFLSEFPWNTYDWLTIVNDTEKLQIKDTKEKV